MANTKSAIKANRQNAKRRLVNVSRKSACKTYMKKLQAYLGTSDADQSTAFAMLQKCQSQLSKAANKNIFKPNNSARKISKIHLAYKAKFSA